MTPADKSPAFATIAPNDLGKRLDRLQDLIAQRAGNAPGALLTDYHEAGGAGAMLAPDEPQVVIVTIITREGQSHVYALPRSVAVHLREQLVELTPGRPGCHAVRKLTHIVAPA